MCVCVCVCVCVFALHANVVSNRLSDSIHTLSVVSNKVLSIEISWSIFCCPHWLSGFHFVFYYSQHLLHRCYLPINLSINLLRVCVCVCVCVSHRRALSQEAGLLHPAGPSELLHVLAEVTLSTLGPHAGLAAPAPRPPAPRPPASPPAQRLTARHPRTSQLQTHKHNKYSGEVNRSHITSVTEINKPIINQYIFCYDKYSSWCIPLRWLTDVRTDSSFVFESSTSSRGSSLISARLNSAFTSRWQQAWTLVVLWRCIQTLRSFNFLNLPTWCAISPWQPQKVQRGKGCRSWFRWSEFSEWFTSSPADKHQLIICNIQDTSHRVNCVKLLNVVCLELLLSPSASGDHSSMWSSGRQGRRNRWDSPFYKCSINIKMSSIFTLFHTFPLIYCWMEFGEDLLKLI